MHFPHNKRMSTQTRLRDARKMDRSVDGWVGGRIDGVKTS